MVLLSLASVSEPTVTETMDYINENIENSVSALHKTQKYLGNLTAEPLSDLVLESDDEVFLSYKEAVLAEFQETVVEPFIKSLGNADVHRMTVGNPETALVIYQTGGPSENGAFPTETYQQWSEVFSQSNPLASLIHAAHFVHLNQPFLPDTETDMYFVEQINLGKLSSARPPF